MIICIWLYFGIKNSYKEVYSKKKVEEIVSDIKQAPHIPKDFKQTIQFVYPKIFNTSIFKHDINSFFGNYENPCPSKSTALRFHNYPKERTFFSGTIQYSLAWYLEGKVTQEECFAYEVINFDFMNNQKGIYNASLYYYKKALKDYLIKNNWN